MSHTTTKLILTSGWNQDIRLNRLTKLNYLNYTLKIQQKLQYLRVQVIIIIKKSFIVMRYMQIYR